MNKIKKLSVRYHGRLVGTLALYKQRQAAFGQHVPDIKLLTYICSGK